MPVFILYDILRVKRDKRKVYAICGWKSWKRDGSIVMEILSPSIIREVFQSSIEAFEDRHKVFRMLLKEGLIT
ncbi:MAG: hypothetical protein A2Y48_04350 [Nitrospirae bacterium RIFCSPLOW2_12_42_9]|nr:MAG: hypothetical protein A2Y48_04350 [Nitrospirae bacterium RIFCSPLOW2_12_42_9]